MLTASNVSRATKLKLIMPTLSGGDYNLNPNPKRKEKAWAGGREKFELLQRTQAMPRGLANPRWLLCS